MNLQISSYNFGEKPPVTLPDSNLFNVLGEQGIREMVSKHYDLLRESPLKTMFPSDNEIFQLAKQNSADFFIQILGGPKYYGERRGKPMLINRHGSFPINPNGRIIWLNCYKQVLMQLEAPKSLIESFWNYLNAFSNWMVNTDSKNN